MSNRQIMGLHHLDHCLHDRDDLTRLSAVLKKVDRCCQAVDGGMNLAEVIRDPKNYQSLVKTFGGYEFDVGLQLLLKLSLHGHTSRSFTVNHSIRGERKIGFIYRTVGAWHQFDAVMTLQIPRPEGGFTVIPINSTNSDHWNELDEIPEGTLVTVYLRTIEGKRRRSQERLACERYQAVLDTVQHESDEMYANQAPIAQIQRREAQAKQPARKPAPQQPAQPAPRKKDPVPSKAPSIFEQRRALMSAVGSTTPASTFKVVINKMDTFVHAGNAHLIITHLRDYQGRVDLYVLRGEKKKVQLDADSVWGAEIRNGETVQYEFFGPEPDEDFLKELANKTNKYTQMDKIAEG